jgi:hypothetical protein
MKNIYLIFIAVIFSVSEIYAQGEYLRKGESGFGISGGFSSIQSKKISGSSAGFSLGYSFKTIVDLNIGTASSTGNEPSTTASLSYYLSHQSNKKNSSAALSVLMQNSLGHAYYGFGFGIARNFNYDNPLLVQSIINFAIFPGVRKTNGTKLLFVFSAGLSIGWIDANGFSIAIGPNVGLQEGIFSLGASAVFVICTSGK